jgi:hypothetical protein
VHAWPAAVLMAWQGCGYLLAGSIVLVMLVRAPESAPART